MKDFPLHTSSQLGELLPHVLLPVGVEQRVQEGVAQSQQPEVALNDSVIEALGTHNLHDASDEKWQPGQHKAADQHGHSAHGLHVTGAAPGQPRTFCFPDLLHVHRGNFQHVTVEVNEEKQDWKEAHAGDNENVAEVEDSEEGAFFLKGDLPKAWDKEWEKANDTSKQPERHQVQCYPRARDQLVIVERLSDCQVPVTRDQGQGQDRSSRRGCHKSHSQDTEDLLGMNVLKELPSDQTYN